MGQLFYKDIEGNNTISRLLDPAGAQQVFNAQQAQLARDFTADQNRIIREFNMSEAQKNRDFQERMSNTSYQRAVADMRASGLNPYLLYGAHGGASQPVGSTASSGMSGSSSASASIGSVLNPLLDFTTEVVSLALRASGKIKGSTINKTFNYSK